MLPIEGLIGKCCLAFHIQCNKDGTFVPRGLCRLTNWVALLEVDGCSDIFLLCVMEAMPPFPKG